MEDKTRELIFFRSALQQWAASAQRPLPWKGSRDPYLIWLSEILLQQTRVAQGMPYYLKFAERFPTVESLAAADDDEVMKLWEGLGYYARAKNMLKTAHLVAGQYGGRFPGAYEGLLALPGVGAYTAAAIASFAFDLPHAVLDGNVFRVLSRYLGIDTPVDTTEGRKYFAASARAALDVANPAAYNQAIMDFGAMVCTPQSPQCGACPLQTHCAAFRQQRVAGLPVKSRSIVKRERFFHYLVMERHGELWIRKRNGKDIWENLYEFPCIELPAPVSGAEGLASAPQWRQWLGGVSHTLNAVSPPFRQTLTHQHITATFWEISVAQEIPQEGGGLIRVERKKLSNFAFPKIIDRYLKSGSLYLNLL